MITHTHPQYLLLETIFGQVNGASIITLDTCTDVPLLGGRANSHQGRVKKMCIGHNVMVFQNKHTNAYDNMVKRRLVAEGKRAEDFQLSPRQWGNRLHGVPFVEHKGNFYLEVIFLRPGREYYMLDDILTDKSMIQGLKEDRQEAEQGGLSDPNKVIIRTYKFESILKVKIGGAEYTIQS